MVMVTNHSGIDREKSIGRREKETHLVNFLDFPTTSDTSIRPLPCNLHELGTHHGASHGGRSESGSIVVGCLCSEGAEGSGSGMAQEGADI